MAGMQSAAGPSSGGKDTGGPADHKAEPVSLRAGQGHSRKAVVKDCRKATAIFWLISQEHRF